MVQRLAAWLGVLLASAIGLAGAAWSAWATWIAFAGGKLPFVPVHFTGANLLRGAAWTVMGDSIVLSLVGLLGGVVLMPLAAIASRGARASGVPAAAEG